MRCSDAHKAQRSAEGGNCTGGERTAQHDAEAEAPERGSAERGIRIAKKNQIQGFQLGKGQRQPHQQQDGHEGQAGIRNAGKTACHPAVEQLEALFSGRILQNGTQGAEHKTQHDAHQEQGSGGLRPRRNGHNQKAREQRTCKGGGNQCDSAGPGAESGDRQRRYGRSQPRAAGHAHQVRIGQGVAEDSLHLCPGERQRSPRHHRREHARQP